MPLGCTRRMLSGFYFPLHVHTYYRGLAAGIYTTNGPDACHFVAHDCKANIIVVENQKQLDKILEVSYSTTRQSTNFCTQRADTACNTYCTTFKEKGEFLGYQGDEQKRTAWLSLSLMMILWTAACIMFNHPLVSARSHTLLLN